VHKDSPWTELRTPPRTSSHSDEDESVEVLTDDEGNVKTILTWEMPLVAKISKIILMMEMPLVTKLMIRSFLPPGADTQ
jgi:hypothetical protein